VGNTPENPSRAARRRQVREVPAHRRHDADLGVRVLVRFRLALAYAGFVLNLFNLIPVSPLDGGRIVSVISPRIWFLGFPILVALFIWRPSPLLILRLKILTCMLPAI
jgi:Zn-dependent protease